MRKLENLQRRRQEVMNKQAHKLHDMVENEQKKYHKLLQNKSKLNHEKDQRRMHILELQQSLMGRADLKDTSVNLNRLNA